MESLMKITFKILFLSFTMGCLSAEDIFTLHGQLQFNANNAGNGGSDVWGYTSPDGEDYAIMGILEGVVFIRAEDLAIIDTVLGPTYNDPYYHRDIKTFGHYAFVVSENTGENEGMQIIDLSGLPDSVHLVESYVYNDQVRSHNLTIDTQTGFAYVCGQYHDGLRVIDINNPETPVDVSFINTEQIHDAFARNDTVYIAEGWRGSFSIYNLAEKTNPELLARVQILNNGYVHTIWPSDDGKYVVTTEETVSKTVKIWSIEDLNNIEITGEYLGENSIAHNAQVLGNRIFISNYTYGMSIVDFSNPSILIESAYFDTYPESNDPSPPWVGNWGIFQYTANDFVYGSDIDGKFTVMKFYKGLDYAMGYGDINGDQLVDVSDFILLVNMIMNQENLTDEQWEIANLNFDNILDVFDLLLLSHIVFLNN
jgi:choice-of-anchor B domain-containing protein